MGRRKKCTLEKQSYKSIRGMAAAGTGLKPVFWEQQ